MGNVGYFYEFILYAFLIGILFQGITFLHNASASNASPTVPKRFRIKSGSKISLNCKVAEINKAIIWEFKSCGMNYRGIECGIDDEFSGEEALTWKLISSNVSRILSLENVTLEDTGIYRCISGSVVRKVFILEIDAVMYEWPPPTVLSLMPSSNVIPVNSHLTMNCSVSSKIPPKILWFKKCWTSICDIDFSTYEIQMEEDSNCLCLVAIANNHSIYNWKNIYISKLHIFNANIWDGGTYVCSALTPNGKDYRNVTIEVRRFLEKNNEFNRKSLIILVFIPVIFILLYIISYLSCTEKKKKHDDSKKLQSLMDIQEYPER